MSPNILETRGMPPYEVWNPPLTDGDGSRQYLPAQTYAEAICIILDSSSKGEDKGFQIIDARLTVQVDTSKPVDVEYLKGIANNEGLMMQLINR